jgi:pantetheine-phosphate adenylyltransferase
MKRIAVYPGTFDPPTYGHLDVIKRALPLFDRVIIAVLDNPGKHCLLTVEERIKIVREITSGMKRVSVDRFKGLLVNYVKIKKACAVIRGLRAVSDFEYEFQMAQMNRELSPGIETVFLMTSTPYSYLSSSLVKEIATFGGNIRKFVPPAVEKLLKKRR